VDENEKSRLMSYCAAVGKDLYFGIVYTVLVLKCSFERAKHKHSRNLITALQKEHAHRSAREKSKSLEVWKARRD
jgi:hypothetical protein